MAAPLLTDAQLRRRRKVQSDIGRTTATLGLVGAGLGATALALKKKPGMFKSIPKLKNATHEGVSEKALLTSLGAGGLGGVGGFNQAKIYRDEARRRQGTVSKMFDAPYMGEIGKAWTPVSSTYDPEAQRRRRSEKYPGIAAGISGGLAGGAVGSGVHAGFTHVAAGRVGRQGREKAEAHAAGMKNPANKERSPKYRALREAAEGAETKLHAEGKARGRTAAVLGGGAVLAGAAAPLLARRHKSKSWQPYSKRHPDAHQSYSGAYGVMPPHRLKSLRKQRGRLKKKEPEVAKGLGPNYDVPYFSEVGKAIHIKPENEGKFTASAKKAGKGIQAHAHAVVNSSKSSELQRKRAQFAINAKKWHHGSH